MRKFTPQGKELLKIDVGGVPTDGTAASCAADRHRVRPGPRIFLWTDIGTRESSNTPPPASASASGARTKTRPGHSAPAHGIAIDAQNVLYVADRENGRIQRFHLDGSYIGEWTVLGRRSR